MRKSRFTDGQVVAIIREPDRELRGRASALPVTISRKQVRNQE